MINTTLNFTTVQPEYDWLIPSPLWNANGYRQAMFFRPALFEYNSDEFMEQFLAAAGQPNPGALQSALLQPPSGGAPNKLFQPVHGCFYLAAASLCCREPGFPDRRVRGASGERTSFVLRKLVGGKEYGWVASGDTPPVTTWQPVGSSGRVLLAGEERLPARPVPLNDGRQLFCGYIPTSSSQTYSIPAQELAVDGEGPLDLPVEELKSRFVTPIAHPKGSQSMVDQLPDPVARDTSVYLLVDLWEYLKENLVDVACAIAPNAAGPGSPCSQDGAPSGTPIGAFAGDKAAEKADLLDFLSTQAYQGSLTISAALQAVAEKYAQLNVTGGADLDSLGFSIPAYSLKNGSPLTDSVLDTLVERVGAALPAQRPPLVAPKLDVSTAVQYVLRFVYERPQCDPPVVSVSLPSQPFTFAPFFDPDAPARPIKIPLPTDISIAGLRKLKKNVTFMMSDAMRKKMEGIAGQEPDLLKGTATLQDAGGGFAFICSFSIQIIFIVAFMLLLVFVVVFNIIFWWMAFFRICLPVPKKFLPEG